MKKGYEYQGKIRKEVWLLPKTIAKLQKRANKNHRKLKEEMEVILEAS